MVKRQPSARRASPGHPPSPGPTEPAPAPGGRRLPPAERRESVLAAAFPLFAVRGRDGTSTRDLARAAGVTEPVLYRHFASKDALFAAVVERATARVVAALDEVVAGRRGAPARLAALADRLEDLLAKMDLELRVLNGAAATHADPATTALVRTAYDRIGAALERAVAGGGLRPGLSARTAGAFLLELGLGASLVRPLGVGAVTHPAYGKAALHLLVTALTR